MLRIRQGDSTAFGILYRKYLPLTATYAATLRGRHASVSDIVQETFARLWARRQEYRGEAGIRTYIQAYVRNICLEEKRFHVKTKGLLQRLQIHRSSPNALHWSGAYASPETAAYLKEMNEHLEQAMARLSMEQKQAIKLHYAEDLSLREAAVTMGCTQKCFESRLYRGLARLRCLLHSTQDEYANPLRHSAHPREFLQHNNEE